MLFVLLLAYGGLQAVPKAAAERAGEPIKRFIIEENFKPPIFGSYSFDPIKQVFETQLRLNSSVPSQIVNKTFIMSTVVGSTHTTQTTKLNQSQFRKLVTFEPPPAKAPTIQWWAKTQLPSKSPPNKLS